jgi:hypothetical protein
MNCKVGDSRRRSASRWPTTSASTAPVYRTGRCRNLAAGNIAGPPSYLPALGDLARSSHRKRKTNRPRYLAR